jgi:hypothetical protein
MPWHAMCRITRNRNTDSIYMVLQVRHGEAGWPASNFFIRYSDRYAFRDSMFGLDNLTRLKTFNLGLTFVFF